MGHFEKVAVVGLLPPQARRIAGEFKSSSLKFIPRNRERQLSQIASQFDRLFVMTRFISHDAWFQIPRDKVQPVNGGMTDLRKQLRRLELAVSAPKKHEVQTVTPAKEAVSMAETDYSVLKTAAPGEKLLFPRPEHVPLLVFERQVMASRSYYRRNHGIESEQRTTDEGIEITINGTRSVAPRPKPAQSSGDGLPNFWMESYLRLITAIPGASDLELAARADAACEAFKTRFG